VLVGVGLTLFLIAPSHSHKLLEVTARLGWAGPIVYVVLHAVAVVVLLPGVFFPLAAGFLFGIGAGTVYSLLGKVLGSLCAYWIARRMFGGEVVPERARRAFDRYPLLHALHQQLDAADWRTVTLIRLVPLIPFKLSNYMFGWMRFRTSAVLIGTTIGAFPYSLVNAYLGALAADLTSLIEHPPTSPRAWGLYGATALLTAAASVAVARRALAALRRAAQQSPTESNASNGTEADGAEDDARA
jgi:uncharacterized membrane protein YdjX (TVP38/TMEM64 family)